MFSDRVRLLPSVPAGSPADRALKAQLEILYEQADPQARRVIEDIAKGEATLTDLLKEPWMGARLDAAMKDGALLAEVSRQVDELEHEGVDVEPFLLRPHDAGPEGSR
jgi:hypothetical protein